MPIILKLFTLFQFCFQHFHQTKFLLYCALIFGCSISAYAILLFLKRSGHKHLHPAIGKFLFVNAEKSDSNALQMGGIPFALISMISISLLFGYFPYLISEHHAQILHYASYSWVGILVYGYLDDRFEIRPIVKLASQLLLNSFFCLKASQVIFPENSAEAFLIMVFLSTAIVNGSNLIDGLDTLSYKVSSTIYFAFIVLAAPVLNLTALFIAMACFCIMSGFYFFNKEPSKIHLGEVGVSCLGFSYIVLAVLTFDAYKNFNPTLSAMSKALFPCVLPLVELSISFFRRLLSGKSPFKGDKLHVHHILHEVNGFSVSNASSIIAGAYLIFLLIGFMIMDPYSSIVAFFVLVFLTVSWCLFLGRKYWFKGEMKINIFEFLLVKKEVRIISSTSLSDFKIILNDKKTSLEKKENRN